MSEKIILYKVVNSENMSMNGGEFDWTKYLPENGQPGKWTPPIKSAIICQNGFHLTKHWNMWINNESNKIYLAKARKIISWDYDKCVCTSVRLIEEVTPKYKNDLNTGDSNTGNWNTGNWNTGHRNTEDRNTGDSNTGNWNTGYRNTGHRNTGYRNTGDSNTGHRNTGNWNTGDSNTGHSNTGKCNTGHRNTGHRNNKHSNKKN